MNYFKKAAAVVASASAVLVFGAGVASASVTHARPNATPSCGANCNALFNEQSGPLYIQATAGHYGNAVTVQHGSNFAKSEDFFATNVGTLRQFIRGGLISRTSYVALNYPHTFPVYENEYSPYGVNSGLCIAVKGTAHNGEGVTLRDCGFAARSLWVADLNNAVADANSIIGVDFPWVNASDRSFSHALSLTYNGVGAQLTVTELATTSAPPPGNVSDAQEFGIELTPLP